MSTSPSTQQAPPPTADHRKPTKPLSLFSAMQTFHRTCSHLHIKIISSISSHDASLKPDFDTLFTLAQGDCQPESYKELIRDLHMSSTNGIKAAHDGLRDAAMEEIKGVKEERDKVAREDRLVKMKRAVGGVFKEYDEEEDKGGEERFVRVVTEEELEGEGLVFQ